MAGALVGDGEVPENTGVASQRDEIRAGKLIIVEPGKDNVAQLVHRWSI